MYKFAPVVLLGLFALSGPAIAAPCSSYPWPLQNGQTADANQVMDNFNCAALTSGSTLNGITLAGTTFLPGNTTFSSTGNIFVGKTVGDSNLLGLNLGTDGTFSFSANMATGGYSIVNSLNGAGTWVQFRNNEATVGSISIGAASTAFNTTSDMRLKTPLPVQTDYRSVLKKLWVGDYEWKKTHVRSFGVLAQQVYPLFPEAITPPRDATELWQADYSKLAPLAIWGVKDLYEIVDAQSNEIATLRAKITALEAQFSRMQQVSKDQSKEFTHLQTRLINSFRNLPSAVTIN